MSEISCEKFRQLYPEFSNYPIPREVCETEEWLDWRRHTHYCQACTDWSMELAVHQRGYSVADFPCTHIAYYVTDSCEEHPNRYECSRMIIDYDARFDEYFIAPRGGHGDDILIRYCPWCGQKLPESKRDLWFETLEALGYDDPVSQEIPKEYETGEWYFNLKLTYQNLGQNRGNLPKSGNEPNYG